LERRGGAGLVRDHTGVDVCPGEELADPLRLPAGEVEPRRAGSARRRTDDASVYEAPLRAPDRAGRLRGDGVRVDVDSREAGHLARDVERRVGRADGDQDLAPPAELGD